MTSKDFRLLGDPDSPRTIVFSHGFGTDQHCWEKLVPGLQEDFRLILFDHAGAHGDKSTGWNRLRYSQLSAYSEDLLRLSEAINLEDAILVGHSAGAIIGLLAAIDAPKRFSKLVLIGATACYRNDGDYKGGMDRDDFVHLYRLMIADYQEWISLFVPRVTGKEEGDAMHSYLKRMLERLQPEVALAMAATVLESDYREWLPLVTQPTLLLQAREDAVVPQFAADYLRQNIPDCRLTVLNAVGHSRLLTCLARWCRRFADSRATVRVRHVFSRLMGFVS